MDKMELAGEANSEKENLPPPALKQPLAKSIFRSNKTVTVMPSPDLFHGLVFFLEIFKDGKQTDDSFFQKAVTQHGGKLSRRLGKHVSHLVWS